MLEKTIILR